MRGEGRATLPLLRTASRWARTPNHARRTTMRKLAAVAMAVIFGFVLPTIAIAKGSHKGTPHVSGTITSWDDTTKQATVKDSTGKETSFGWNDATKVSGTPKVGEHASVSYTKDKD